MYCDMSFKLATK